MQQFLELAALVTPAIRRGEEIRDSSADHFLPPVAELLQPVVRHGDDQWYDIVNWTVMALIQAEEFGITSKNVDEMFKSKDPEIQRFLGVTPGLGKALGLDENWAYNIVKQVGNYGQIYEANVGVNTSLGIPRGLNDQWYKGGLMFAAPFR